MSEHHEGDDLNPSDDYLTGDDATGSAIPRITGIPGQRKPLGKQIPRQRRAE